MDAGHICASCVVCVCVYVPMHNQKSERQGKNGVRVHRKIAKNGRGVVRGRVLVLWVLSLCLSFLSPAFFNSPVVSDPAQIKRVFERACECAAEG